jgi:hypothetical protein
MLGVGIDFCNPSIHVVGLHLKLSMMPNAYSETQPYGVVDLNLFGKIGNRC